MSMIRYGHRYVHSDNIKFIFEGPILGELLDTTRQVELAKAALNRKRHENPLSRVSVRKTTRD